MKTKLSALLFLLLCSCGGEAAEEGADQVIRIDLLSEPKSTVTKLSDFAEKVEYIPLQTTRESFISQARGIISVGDKFYVYNAFDKKILCFDINGNFLFKLDKEGRGPGEYPGIFYHDVSSDNKYLTVLDVANMLHFYSISETGFTFEKSIPMGNPYPMKLGMVPGTDYLFLAIGPRYGTEPYLSLMIDKKGDTILYKPNCNKFISPSRGFGMTQETMWVYSVENSLCFRENYSDTVFYADVAGNSFKPRIIFDTHGTSPSPPGVGTVRNHTTGIRSISETPRYIYYFYSERINGVREEKGVLFDKKTKIKYGFGIGLFPRTNMVGKSLDFEMVRLKDDLGWGPDIYVDVSYWDRFVSGGKVYCFIDAITLKQYVGGEEFKNTRTGDPKKKEELKRLADSLEETDNPVLLVITPKE